MAVCLSKESQILIWIHLISSACLDMDPTCHTRPTRKCLSVALNRNCDLSGACNRWASCSLDIIPLPSVSLDVHKSCFPSKLSTPKLINIKWVQRNPKDWILFTGQGDQQTRQQLAKPRPRVVYSQPMSTGPIPLTQTARELRCVDIKLTRWLLR